MMEHRRLIATPTGKTLLASLPGVFLGAALLLSASTLSADELWEDFEAFELGSPQGQFGWQSSPLSDHEIVDAPTIEDLRSLRISSVLNVHNVSSGTESPSLLDLAATSTDYDIPTFHGYFRASLYIASADPPGERHDHGISVCVPTAFRDFSLPDRYCVAQLYVFNLPDGLQVEYLTSQNYTLNTYQSSDCLSGTEETCGLAGWRSRIVANGLAHDAVHSIDIEMRLTAGSSFSDGAFTDIVKVTVNDTTHYVAESSAPSLGTPIGSIVFGDAWTGAPDPYDYSYTYLGNGFLVDNVRLYSVSPRITDLTVVPNPVHANENLNISAIAYATPATGIPELVTEDTSPYPGIGTWTVAWAQWFFNGSPVGMMQPQDGAYDSPVEVVETSTAVSCCGEFQLCVTATDEIGGAHDLNWRAHEAGIMGLPECVTVEVLPPDNDGDGVSDDEDPDDDNDGQPDSAELACGGDPLDPAVLAPDGDGDGSPDCVDSDDDNDSLDDHLDVCPDTHLPDGGLTTVQELGKNRWSLLANTNGTFVQAPPQAGSKHSFSIADTRGCSCQQIVESRALGANHLEEGCSTSTMVDWVNQ